MKNYLGKDLKIELMQKNLLINAVVVMVMLLGITTGTAIAGYLLLISI